MADGMISVEVIYAEATGPIRRQLTLPAGSTVARAVDASGIADVLGAGESFLELGVFGRKVSPDRIAQDGDRIEIYRPLVLSPMEARRRRAR
jgi:putative ubiquitin-RnfH superfamily antitoxin RatB of RatAB toxin-antitoxin module